MANSCYWINILCSCLVLSLLSECRADDHATITCPDVCYQPWTSWDCVFRIVRVRSRDILPATSRPHHCEARCLRRETEVTQCPGADVSSSSPIADLIEYISTSALNARTYPTRTGSCPGRPTTCAPVQGSAQLRASPAPSASGGYEHYSCVTQHVTAKEVHVLAVYQPEPRRRFSFVRDRTRPDTIHISIIRTPGSANRPVDIILSSYEPVNWTISCVGDTIVLDKVIILSYYRQHTTYSVNANCQRTPFAGTVTHNWYVSHSGRRLGRATTINGFITSFTGQYETSGFVLSVGVTDACGSDTSDGGQQTGVAANAQEVEACMESEDCWVEYNFTYSRIWTDCHGRQYVRNSGQTIGRYVGVVLCTNNRYKLFMSDNLTDTFLNIADGSGHGQDHCVFVGGTEDGANLPGHFWDCPSATGYYRYNSAQPIQKGAIGATPSWTGKYYCRWYECGVNIPGDSRVVQFMTSLPTTSRARTSSPPTTTTTTTTSATTRAPTSLPTSATTQESAIQNTSPNGRGVPTEESATTAATSQPRITFSIRPTNITSGLGTFSYFECETRPDSQVKWYHVSTQNQPLVSGNGLEVDGGALLFNSIQRQHVGRYICRAQQGSDIIEATAHLRVPGLSAGPSCAHVFTLAPKDAVVEVGRSHRLRCRTSDGTTSISWEKEGAPIHGRVGNVAVRSVGVLFGRATYADSGEYTCVATSNDGCEIRRSAVINIVARDPDVCGQPIIDQPGSSQSEDTLMERVPYAGGTPYIVGGATAREGSSPWHVMLYYELTLVESGHMFCGGVLIDSSHVITAGHCFTEFESFMNEPFQIENLRLKFGKIDSMNSEPEEVVKSARSLVIHQNFSIGVEMDNDIAILELETPVTFTNYIRPACLGASRKWNKVARDGARGIATGWGRFDSYSYPRHLKEIRLPIQTRDVCRESRDQPDQWVTDNMFCAGYRAAIRGDTCEGDSGGPFVVQHPDDGRWYVVGLVSWGDQDCAREGQFGFFTRLTNYRVWIHDQISANN